jgi:predicted DNA-binding transcriptional regulator AlpA
LPFSIGICRTAFIAAIFRPVPNKSVRRRNDGGKFTMAVRKVLRKKAVLEATGWSQSTLYEKMAANKFPRGTKLDPDGQTRVWFEDEVEAFQKGEWKAQEVAA